MLRREGLALLYCGILTAAPNGVFAQPTPSEAAGPCSPQKSSDDRLRIVAAFLGGTPAPADPLPEFKTLAAHVSSVQEGTDGTAEGQARRLADIRAVASEIDPCRPELPRKEVISIYLRCRAASLAKSTAGSSMSAPDSRRIVDRARHIASGFVNGPLDDAPPPGGFAGSLLPERSAGALAPRVYAAPYADVLTQRLRSSPSAEMLSLDRGSMPAPIFDTGGGRDSYDAARNYIHDFIALHDEVGGARAARLDQRRSAACAPGLGADCAGLAARSGVEHMGLMFGSALEGLTSSDNSTRIKAWAQLTPMAITESAPEALAAVRQARDNGYAGKDVAIAALDVGIAVLDAVPELDTTIHLAKSGFRAFEKPLAKTALKPSNEASPERIVPMKGRNPHSLSGVAGNFSVNVLEDQAQDLVSSEDPHRRLNAH